MKKDLYVCLALALLVSGLARSAAAAVLLDDDFDGYADQAALEAAWPSISTAGAALLSTARFVSGPNAAFIEPSGISASRRSRGTFAETDTIGTLADPAFQLTWSFDFYDSITGNPQRNFSNLQDGTVATGTNQLVSMGLHNNQLSTNSGGNYYMARIVGYSPPTTPDPDGGPTEGGVGSTMGSGSFFKLNDEGVGLRSVGWHHLKVQISSDNGLSTDYRFYVDGQLAETVSNVGTAASLRSWDNITLGGGLGNSVAAAYYDNMFLEVVVPEPGSAALLGLGIGALALRRRCPGGGAARGGGA